MPDLYLFDNDKCITQFAGLGSTSLSLFPLTSAPQIINQIGQSLKNHDIAFEIVNTSSKVHEATEFIRQNIHSWAKDFGNEIINGKTIKKMFLIPDSQMSTFYFTLAAEKNPLKTDLFLKLAQFLAIRSELESHAFTNIYVNINDTTLANTVYEYLRDRNHRFQKLGGLSYSDIFIQSLTTNKGFIGSILRALGFLLRSLMWSHIAKKMMGKNWKDQLKDQCLLVQSYFPLVDKKQAEQGVFKNKYYGPFQDLIEKESIPYVWLLHFVFIDGFNFNNAVKLARSFKQNGQRLIIVEQIFGIKIFIEVIITWSQQLLRYFKYRKKILGLDIHQGLALSARNGILIEMLDNSFCGTPAIQGIYYYYLFEELAKCGRDNLKLAIYQNEMQNWEKAFNVAFKQHAHQLSTLGYQHTSVTPNYFFYYIHPDEIGSTPDQLEHPLPDIFGVCGERPRWLLEKCRYPNLKVFPALRKMASKYRPDQQHINESRKPSLIFLGSYDSKETKANLSLLIHAFPSASEFPILLKGHPSCSLGQLCKELGVDVNKSGYQLVDGDINELLRQVTIAIVGTSTACIDALGMGCHVIIPVLNDALNLSPLLGNPDFYTLVGTSTELKKAVENFKHGKNEHEFQCTLQFIKDFWYFDDTLAAWKEIIGHYCKT